jgi:hypothetical protein
MAQNVKMKGLERDFVASFWTIEYFRRHIYVWNKTLKHIISQCGMDFRFVPLHIFYNSQHFEPIEMLMVWLSLHLRWKQMIPKL